MQNDSSSHEDNTLHACFTRSQLLQEALTKHAAATDAGLYTQQFFDTLMTINGQSDKAASVERILQTNINTDAPHVACTFLQSAMDVCRLSRDSQQKGVQRHQTRERSPVQRCQRGLYHHHSTF